MNNKILLSAFVGLMLTSSAGMYAFADAQNPVFPQVQRDQQIPSNPSVIHNQDWNNPNSTAALPNQNGDINNTDMYGANVPNAAQDNQINANQNVKTFLGVATDIPADQIKAALKADPNLNAFADKIGVINCNGKTFVFGAVDNETAHQAIVAKIKGMDGFNNLQDKIIVVVK
jgi:hypothetical protein